MYEAPPRQLILRSKKALGNKLFPLIELMNREGYHFSYNESTPDDKGLVEIVIKSTVPTEFYDFGLRSAEIISKHLRVRQAPRKQFIKKILINPFNKSKI